MVSDGDKIVLAGPKSLVEADNSSGDCQSTPLLSPPAVKSSGDVPRMSNMSHGVFKREKPAKRELDRSPSKNFEELQQSVREKVMQIFAKSCESAVESILQVTEASFQQVSKQPESPNGKSAGWKVGSKPEGTPTSAEVEALRQVVYQKDQQISQLEDRLRVAAAGGDGVAGASGAREPVPQMMGNADPGSETKDLNSMAREIWEHCHACGNQYLPDARFCRACAAPRVHFPPQDPGMSCPSCGNMYHGDSKFCRKCGARRENFPEVAKGKHRKSRKSRIGRRSIHGAQSDGSAEEERIGPEKPRGIFADSDTMKKQLREAIAQPDYDVSRYYWDSGFAQAIARSTTFDNVTLFVIAINALWISVDTDYNDATVLTDADPIFQVVDNLFCIYFVFEWAIRFGAFRRKKDCLKDYWFVFDSLLALIMAGETWIMTLLIMMFSKGSGEGLGDASLLKVVRLVRLVRMARVIRILNALPELMVLIKGMFVATRAVSCTVALMLIIIYVFAVVFRQLTADSAFGKRIFPDVPRTMRYLLLQGTMPDLYEATTDIWEEGWLYALLFLFFLLVVSITVMNMLVGVLVGVVNTVASVEKEQLMVNFVKSNLLGLLKNLAVDRDDDGMINVEEFKALINIPEAIRSFDSMGVDVVGLVDLSEFIFKNGNGIPFADFMELVMQLRGTNQATVKDIVDLRKFILIEHKRLERMLTVAKERENMALACLAMQSGGEHKPDVNDLVRKTAVKLMAVDEGEMEHADPFLHTTHTVMNSGEDGVMKRVKSVKQNRILKSMKAPSPAPAGSAAN